MLEASDVRSAGLRMWWTICLAAMLSALFPPAGAQGTLCGATIVSDLALDEDLTCVGTALVIGADGITLDLNGHTITGSGTGEGVLISGRSGLTVKNGTISNFASGVRILDSSNVTIKGCTLHENTDGVDCAAGCVSSTIRDSTFQDNRTRGVMLRGSTSDISVKDNRFSGDRVGVLLFGCVGCTVKDNEFLDSLLAGVRINVLATGNNVKDNSVSGAPGGIEFLITPTGSAVGNAIRGNSLSANACGLKGPLVGNVVKDNTFNGNAADICP
jgi:parallel beta-helix repeat protein